jgi:RecJ-like exonuclease
MTIVQMQRRYRADHPQSAEVIDARRDEAVRQIHDHILALALLWDARQVTEEDALLVLQDVVREASRRMVEIGGGGRVREQIAQMIEQKAEALARLT